MPTAAIHSHPGGPMPAVNSGPAPPLRRAVYIHVSDLTSAYDIDHARLEQELARVKADRENPPEETAGPRLGVPTELDTGYQKRLQPPRGGYNLCMLVGNVHVVVDKHRVDGSRVRLAEVEVGDETGAVSLRARDEQIDVLQEVSARKGAVVLRNCTLELYQGKHIRLAITKWGKLNTYPDQVASTPPPPSKMNRDRNFSLIDLSLVASEMASLPQTVPYHSAESEGSGVQAPSRMQPYQTGQGAARRGRRPSRGKPVSTGMPVHYGGEGGMSNPMRYQGGLHGYGGGFGEGMDVQSYSYPPRQQESSAQQQQQMMMQQQFQMQRQMQQMYQQDRSRHLQNASPMVVPGIPNTGSFDASFSSSSDVPMPILGSNAFMVPIHGSQAPAPHRGTLSPQTSGNLAGSDPPVSPGRMNPQAATFDPTMIQHQPVDSNK